MTGTGFTTKQYTDRRRPPWLWPVVALAAVVVVAVVVGFSLSGGGGPPAAAQHPGPAPTSAPPAGPVGGGDSGSTHQPNDPNYLTAAPAGLRFQDVGGLTLPFSPVDGPLRINGPIAAGYSLISYRATHPQDNPAELAAQLSPPVGFRIESYAPDRATVVMLNRPGGNAGGFTAGRALVVWVGGDWKLPDNSSSTLSAVPDSTGYTLF